MTDKEILNGLEYRLKNLKEARDCLEKSGKCKEVVEDLSSRIDEIESIHLWIKENSRK